MNKTKFAGLTVFAATLLMRTGVAYAASACATPDAPLRPLMQTHTIPPYPEMSVMTNEAGSTMVEVAIGTDGVPTDVKIVSSSGSLRLDEAARDHVKSVWRWSSPIKDCMPVPVRTRVNIAWDLKDAPPPPPPPASSVAGIPPQMLANSMSFVSVDDAEYPSGLTAQTDIRMAMLMVVVSETGAVDAMSVESSGVPELDAKSLMLAKTKYHWVPTMLNGKPTGGSHLLIMAWTPPGVKKLDPGAFKDMVAAYLKSKGSQAAARPQN